MAEAAFEAWDPTRFASDARYQRTIRTFLEGKLRGDILDVGCGSRVFYGLQEARSWTGLDVSDRMLSGIQFHDDIANKDLRQGDVLDLPFADGAFDTVVAFFLLHHLGRHNRRQSARRVQQAFSEAKRVLRPGGRLLVGENCRGPLEAPYHWVFPLTFPVARRAFGAELPYFWRARDYEAFGRDVGFLDPPLYVHVPVVEWIYQPVLKVSVPPILSHDLIQKMMLFEFRTAHDRAE